MVGEGVFCPRDPRLGMVIIVMTSFPNAASS